MSEFRPCDYCGETSVVIVNSKSACVKHIDAAMGAAFAPVRAWHDEPARWERTGHLDAGPCECPECLVQLDDEARTHGG